MKIIRMQARLGESPYNAKKKVWHIMPTSCWKRHGYMGACPLCAL